MKTHSRNHVAPSFCRFCFKHLKKINRSSAFQARFFSGSPNTFRNLIQEFSTQVCHMYECFPIVQLVCPNTPSPEYEFFDIKPFDDLNFQPENVDSGYCPRAEKGYMAGVEAKMLHPKCRSNYLSIKWSYLAMKSSRFIDRAGVLQHYWIAERVVCVKEFIP